MQVEIITREDLASFRLQLLEDIRQLLVPVQQPAKPWLKNAEVKKLLSISSSTLQRLRIAGKLRSTRIGSVHYYRQEDIEILLNGKGR